MPEVAKELNPHSTETREVTCYVQSTWHKQVFISLEDVPWLVRMLHDQAKLGGVPLIHTDPSDGGEEKTPKKAKRSSSSAGDAGRTGDGDEERGAGRRPREG